MVSLSGRTRAAKLEQGQQIQIKRCQQQCAACSPWVKRLAECEEPVLRKKRLLHLRIGASMKVDGKVLAAEIGLSLFQQLSLKALCILWDNQSASRAWCHYDSSTEHLSANLKFWVFKTDGSHFSAASNSISWPLAARVLFLTQVWFLDCSWTRGLAHLYLYY